MAVGVFTCQMAGSAQILIDSSSQHSTPDKVYDHIALAKGVATTLRCVTRELVRSGVRNDVRGRFFRLRPVPKKRDGYSGVSEYFINGWFSDVYRNRNEMSRQRWPSRQVKRYRVRKSHERQDRRLACDR